MIDYSANSTICLERLETDQENLRK